jgi:excisionase family DNA binding protein
MDPIGTPLSRDKGAGAHREDMDGTEVLRNSGTSDRAQETLVAGNDRGRRVWSVEEAAQLLGVSRAHAYELVARNELPHLRLGRRIVVPKHVIDELLAVDVGR